VTATGTVPLSYQWYKDGNAISGAVSSRYSRVNVQATDAGTYTVTVSNGTLPNATSVGAVLTVGAPVVVTDIDGNVYHTVGIGTQVWAVENLKTTRLNDSTEIPLITDPAVWGSLPAPAYCWYNDSAVYGDTYGALYNWFTVNTGKLAPTGWHVSTDSDWNVLTSFLGGDSVAGGKLKETGTTHWLSYNTGATNATGFTALPGGYRYDYGTFYNGIGNYGYWWSSTENVATDSWFRAIGYNSASVTSLLDDVGYGFSVRIVRDQD
jgi:uncharacterized protein (TIGR02145 family)